MVTKVELPMLAEKVIKNAELVGDKLTFKFSDGTEKQITIVQGDGEPTPIGNIAGLSGTLCGAVAMAEFSQVDVPLMTSDPFTPPPALQVSVDAKEVGSYLCVAMLNPNGCHESKSGETVTATYFGKSWTYNSRTTGLVGQFQMDTLSSHRQQGSTSDTFVPGGYSTTLNVARIFKDVTIGIHTFSLCIFQSAAADACAYRCATMFVFRI